MSTYFRPEESNQQNHEAVLFGSRISRRAFLGMTGAVLLAGCGAPSPSNTRPATPGSTPTSAPVLLPAGRIEPENASRLTSLGVLDAHTMPVRGLAWSPDGNTLALSADQEAQLWNVKTGKRLASLQGHTSLVYWVAWSPDGSTLASASLDGTVRLWDTQQHSMLRRLQDMANPTPMISLAWSPDSHRLASGDARGRVQLWEASTGSLLSTWNDPPLQSPSTTRFTFAVYGLGWSPDGQYVAANRYDGFLRIWEARTGKSAAVLQTLTGPNGLAWSPDGRVLSVGTDTGAIQLWDTRTWKNSATLLESDDADGWTYSVPWSPDGRLLASSRQEALVQIWDTGAGKKLADLRGHTGDIWAAAWSPDGLRLASGSDDGTARLWGVRQA